MNGLPADARRDLPLALVAAATTWVTMLSWRGFSTQWGAYMGPLLLLAAVVACGGVLFRAAPMPRRLSLVLHVLVVALLVWLMMGGSLLHPVGGAHHEVASRTRTLHDRHDRNKRDPRQIARARPSTRRFEPPAQIR